MLLSSLGGHLFTSLTTSECQIYLHPRDVNFGYSATQKLVLKNMSFSIGAGQLCVIVGENGRLISVSTPKPYSIR